MDSETSEDQSDNTHLSSNEDCESDHDRSNGSPQLSWDHAFNEVITLDGSNDQRNLNDMLHDAMNDARIMTEDRDCELPQVYPTAKFEYKRVNNVSAGNNTSEVSTNTQVDEASMSNQIINLYSLNVHNLHNTETVMRDMFEIARLKLHVPEIQIVVAEDTKNFIMSVNPYRERKGDIMSDRLTAICSYIWDSAALTILKATSPRM